MASGISPAIKWTGSKRSVAPIIAGIFPAASRYIEPFVGGGALLPYRPAREAVAGDVIPELIELWKLIQKDSDKVADSYEHRWARLQREGHMAFYSIRSRFNRVRNPVDLFFLTRTCVNGLIRFNDKKEFNNSLHHTRKGISPQRLRRVLKVWAHAITKVTFVTADYRETLASAGRGDVIFLDPPYLGSRGRYLRCQLEFGPFCAESKRLNNVGAKWILTFDGEAGSRKYEGRLPKGLYTTVLKIKTGQSPFTRVMDNKLEQVVESVYLNFNPTRESLRKVAQHNANPGSRWIGEDVEQNIFSACSEFNS